jgi:hypothetical protein
MEGEDLLGFGSSSQWSDQVLDYEMEAALSRYGPLTEGPIEQ